MVSPLTEVLLNFISNDEDVLTVSPFGHVMYKYIISTIVTANKVNSNVFHCKAL